MERIKLRRRTMPALPPEFVYAERVAVGVWVVTDPEPRSLSALKLLAEFDPLTKSEVLAEDHDEEVAEELAKSIKRTAPQAD